MSAALDIKTIITEAESALGAGYRISHGTVRALIDATYQRDEEIFSLKEQRRRDLIVWGQTETKIEVLVDLIIPLLKRVQSLEQIYGLNDNETEQKALS